MLSIPFNISEQKKVGDFFITLDHLITLHQSKSFGHILKAIVSCTLSWEQRKHGEVFIYLRNNTLSREELNDEDGFAQSIHYGDVLIKYGECLNVSKELLPYIDNKNIVNKFKKFYIQNGDVIIADTAEDETVGKCIEISGIVDHNIISGLHTIPLRPVNKFAYGYLGFYLNSNSYHNQLKPLMQGIKVTSISKNLLKTTTLNYPSNIQEQKIIGRYFDALNHLITLHQRKLEKLKIIKKSMLENLFPQNGEKTPKIRFSGFTKDWEQRKLGEIGMIITGSTPSTSLKYYYTDDSDEGIVWVTPTDIINNITVESEKRLTSLGQKVAHIVPPNTILVTCIASIGKNTMLIDRGSFNQQINGLIPYKNKYEPYFLLTESFIWSNKMKSLAPAGTIQIVNRKEFSEIDADIPNKSEQNSVGSFFRTLNHLITLHQLEPFQLIFKAIAYRIIDYTKSKPPSHRK